MKMIKNISLLAVMAIMATLFGCSTGNSNKSNPNPQSYLSQPTGNYTSTCTNVYWYGESGFLSGLCQTESNGFITSVLNYNKCTSGSQVNNVGGNLVCASYNLPPAPTGNYTSTCEQISWDGAILSAKCQVDGSGSQYDNESSILRYSACESGSQVNNNGGILVCANPIPVPPGSYTGSCSDIQYDGSFLTATCSSGKGSPSYQNILKVSNCAAGSDISNNKGRLSCTWSSDVPQGSYLTSCINTIYFESSGLLMSSCAEPSSDNTAAGTTYLANTLEYATTCAPGSQLVNNNGYLECSNYAADIPIGSYMSSCHIQNWRGGSLNATCSADGATSGSGVQVSSSLEYNVSCASGSTVNNEGGYLTCATNSQFVPTGTYSSTCNVSNIDATGNLFTSCSNGTSNTVSSFNYANTCAPGSTLNNWKGHAVCGTLNESVPVGSYTASCQVVNYGSGVVSAFCPVKESTKVIRGVVTGVSTALLIIAPGVDAVADAAADAAVAANKGVLSAQEYAAATEEAAKNTYKSSLIVENASADKKLADIDKLGPRSKLWVSEFNEINDGLATAVDKLAREYVYSTYLLPTVISDAEATYYSATKFAARMALLNTGLAFMAPTAAGAGGLNYVANSGDWVFNQFNATGCASGTLTNNNGNLTCNKGSTPIQISQAIPNPGLSSSATLSNGQGIIQQVNGSNVYNALVMQSDNNLVMYNCDNSSCLSGVAIWNTNTSTSEVSGQVGGTGYAQFNSLGQLCVYSTSSSNGSNLTTWCSSNPTASGNQIIFQPDGNLVIYSGSTAVWNTGTSGQ